MQSLLTTNLKVTLCQNQSLGTPSKGDWVKANVQPNYLMAQRQFMKKLLLSIDIQTLWYI